MIRRRIILSASFLLLLLIGGAAILWKASTELTSPARRTLQDYHRDWLTKPAEHGITIQPFTASDGQVPCLLVLPDANAGLSPRGEKLRRQLEDKGITLAPFGQTIANLVFLHGRNGRKEDLLPIAERFCAIGFRCILPDLPASGESPIPIVHFGASDFEAALPGQVLDQAIKQFHLPNDPAGLWGMSMGGSFLAHAALRDPDRWKALVVVCSFDSLDTVVERKAATYLYGAAPLFTTIVKKLAVARGGIDPGTVQPAQWAAKISIPVFIAHGDKDALIKLEQGRSLYEAYASKDKVWTIVKDGDHDRILVTEHPLYAEMAEWFLKSLR